MSIPEADSRGGLLYFLKQHLLANNNDVQLGTTTITGDLSVTGDVTVSDDLTVGDVIIQESWYDVPAYGAGKGYDFTQYWSVGTYPNAQHAGFMKDSMAFVHLRGYAECSNSGASATIFTLPTGYRPALDLEYVVYSSYGAMRISIGSDGTVDASTGWTMASGKWLSLNGIIFDIR